MAIDEEEAKPPSIVKFVISGFGPFGGVPSNPTKVLVEKLGPYWASLNGGGGDTPLVESVLQFIQLETSAEDVRAVVGRLKEQLDPHGNLRGFSNLNSNSDPSSSDPSSKTRIVLLHLGVDSSSKGFKLERCAWNDASFRIPDEQGYQPTKEKVVPDQGYEQCTETNLNLDKLLDVMVQSYPKIQTSISTDAGRYVCNYVYCTSLDAFRHRDDVTSLFLHVPPFEVVPEIDQLAYVTGLVRAIATLPSSWKVVDFVQEK
jgi:pyroglutamyl-peptidase